jgi:NADH-quinone oxidoreductase subunit G
MATVKIDDIEVEVGDDSTIMQAAEEAGVEIPHLCYQRHLSLSGTCRLCLVEVAGIPKLQTACSTPVRDGMEIITASEKVAKARRAMLEFLLLNHPLDCPVCDQAGECKLQDYVFQYGPAQSRFEGEKRTYPRMDIGDRLVRNMNRCVHCLRCVRFCREVAGQEDFGVFYRGGRKDVGTYVEGPVENNYSGNLVDICPVGALTSKDFRFKARVWNTRPVNSICPGCSTGCNVRLWVKGNQVLRITPRENGAVNGAWMCDLGRETHKVMEDQARLKSPMLSEDGKFVPVEWEEARRRVARSLKTIMEESGPGAIAGIGSSRATNEADYLFRKFMHEVLGTPHLNLFGKGQKAGGVEAEDRILLRADRTPNYRGAVDMGIAPGAGGMGAGELLEAAAGGRIRALFIMGADPLSSWHPDDEGISGALEKVELLVVMDPLLTETARKASVILPALFFAETEGTYTNYEGRVQKLNRAVRGPEGCMADWEIIRDLCAVMGVNLPYKSAGDVMEEIAAEIPAYAGVSYASLGDEGVLIEG